jgi:serine/threonine protein kinase
MHQIIVSVCELHNRDILHRDLKPSNIILNSDSSAKLILADFSSAYSIRDRGMDSDIDIDLYGIDGPLVDEETLLYSPPEVALSIGIYLSIYLTI